MFDYFDHNENIQHLFIWFQSGDFQDWLLQARIIHFRMALFEVHWNPDYYRLSTWLADSCESSEVWLYSSRL